jgi:DNA-binding MarR family transcriptional regulator
MESSDQRPRIAYPLSQLGNLAAQRFAAGTKELGLTPAQVGVLRILRNRPGLSQRGLAEVLGSAPSRVVALIDGLQSAGLVERRRSTSDRRNHELALTGDGAATLGKVRAVAEAHEREITQGLSPDDYDDLARLLNKLAQLRGLARDVHPGYSAS